MNFYSAIVYRRYLKSHAPTLSLTGRAEQALHHRSHAAATETTYFSFIAPLLYNGVRPLLAQAGLD